MKSIMPQSLFLALHNMATTSKRNGLLAVTLTIGVVSVVSSHVFADNLIESVQGQLEREQWEISLLQVPFMTKER